MRLSDAEEAANQKQRDAERAERDAEIIKARRKYRWSGFTKQEIEFLEAKGTAFRDLWVKRHLKGMTLIEKRRFTEQVLEFHKTEEP